MSRTWPKSERDAAAIEAQSNAFERCTPQEILEVALFEYGPRVAISTAFGLEGCALIHMASEIVPNVTVFTIDTGFLFPETIELRERVARKYAINLDIIRPEETVLAEEDFHGFKLFDLDFDRCCSARKVEPNRRFLTNLDCWISGIRRDQSPSRAQTRHVELLENGGRPLIKVNPLASWTRAETWRYVNEHDVPYNNMLDRGYQSIGCWPCTRPVAPEEGERDGRWAGTKVECGIHLRSDRRRR